MSGRKVGLAMLLVFVVLFTTSIALSAQGTSATVTGFVTDATGAKIAAATVIYTNTATGVSETATTNAAGQYRVTGLLPGNYRSTVTMAGFRMAVREGIDLRLEDQVALDYSLEVGNVSESVTVQGSEALLETVSPTVSQVIEGKQVEDTPLNGRNTMNLVALTPGVVPQGGTQGSASNNANGGAFTNANSFGNYQIAGGLAAQGGVYVDGAPINVIQANAVTFVITQDAVQEFRVESSVVNPQFGQFGGGVISFGTKIGANALHGSLYEYFRNTIFNANTFFNDKNGVPRPKFNQNQFGTTVGGPLKRDKAFFFGSYEGYRLALGVVNSGRVPTPAELNGDFTADPKIINPVPTVNPVTRVPTYSQVQCGGVLNKFCIGAPVHPGDAVADPTSLYLANTLHYFPTPNVPNNNITNFAQNGKANSFSNEETFRVDYNLNAKNRLFGRFTRLDRTQDPTQFFNNPIGPQSFTGVGATASQYVVGDTITLNQTAVADVRLSYLRYFSYLTPANTNVNLAQLDNGDGVGFWTGAAGKLLPYFPAVSITNNAAFPYTGLDQAAHQPLNLYTLSGTFTKVLGKHTLGVGGEFRQGEEYFFNQPFLTGAFVFAGTSTGCVPSAIKACASGVVVPGSGETPIADFVSGFFAAAPGGFTTVSSPSVVNHYAGIFFNDTYTLSPKLTVTAGVRYEIPGSYDEKHDDNAVILPQLASPLVLVNSSAYTGRGDLVAHHTLFSPRVGFSFAPYTGTTLRAGYSLAYLPQDSAAQASPAYSSINSPVTFIPAGQRLCAPLGFTTGTAVSNTCNSANGVKTIILPPGRAGYAANPNIFNGQTISGRDPYFSFPYLEQWNVNVQQTLDNSTTLQLAYLGARGVHIPVTTTYDINQVPDNAALSQANRPYPLFQNVNLSAPYFGRTYYDSAQVTLTRRFKGGGTLLGNYSWSKFLSTAESTTAAVESHTEGVIQDYDNLRAEKSYLSCDVPHRFVISYILELPVGRGRSFLRSAGPAVNEVVSGWSVSGINTFQSGFPLAIVGAPTLVSAAYGGGTPRPNIAPGCNLKSSVGQVQSAETNTSTFNAACFSSPVIPTTGAVAANYFGNAPRTSGILRTQGTDNWDFSIGKATPIHDSVNLVFRAESFNVANRVQFGDPGLTVGTNTFGVNTTNLANASRSFQFSLRANY